uniref:Amine oxidase n=1 Tax=Sus scrofa TaxID=9823 RepID=A0A8D0UMK3_PIG
HTFRTTKAAPVPFSVPGILVLGLLLAAPSCFGEYEDLVKCFQDPEYESILVTAQKGLHFSPLPKRVVVEGPGMSGLTAAKALQDAGHQVTTMSGGRVVTFRNKKEGHVPLGQVPCFACIHSRLVHTYVRKLGLKLNKFIQYDGNTWFLINGKHYRTREVKANPELLGYSMNPKEKGKNAMNLFYQSIEKVTPASPIPDHLLSFCDSYSTKAYLLKEGMLSQGAVKTIGDVLNEESGHSKSLLESLQAYHIHPLSSLHPCGFSEITGGFDQLPKALNMSLKPGTIHLGSRMKTVVRDGPEVRISYQVGKPNSTLHTLTADFVIISRLITFEPPLSLGKMDALRSVHHTILLGADGIRGGISITDRPSRYIYYPSHSFPSGKGVLLASYTVDDDSLFFLSMNQDQVVDIVLEDLAAVHQMPKEELRRRCPSSFTPHQLADYSQQLFQPEDRIYFAGEHTSLPHAWIDTAIKSGLRAARDIQAAVDEEATGGQKTFTNTQDHV